MTDWNNWVFVSQAEYDAMLQEFAGEGIPVLASALPAETFYPHLNDLLPLIMSKAVSLSFTDEGCTLAPHASRLLVNGVTSNVAELNWGSFASLHWRCSWHKLKTFQAPTQASANQIALCKYPSADATQSHSCNTRKVMWLAVVTMMVASAPSFRHALRQALTPTPRVNGA